jgi:predicted dehydrogenase
MSVKARGARNGTQANSQARDPAWLRVMFRWGVLSTAKIGREHVLPAILQSSNGILAGIASRDIHKAAALAEQFDAKVFPDYDGLLSSADVDGVYIPLPNSEHVRWSLKAMAAGKHVLCEKPIALNSDDISALIDARDRAHLLVSEAFAVYHHPQWAKARQLLRDGAIGRLRHVQGAYSYFNADHLNIRNQLGLGGGGLRDIGVYMGFLTRVATGAEPKRVQAKIDLHNEFRTDCYASVKADFGEFELSFYCSTIMALRQFMVFHGESGFMEIHAPVNAGVYDHPRIELHRGRHDHAEVFRFPGPPQYRLQVEAFANAALGKEAAVVTLENSRLNQLFLEAIYRAGSHDGWEPVPPVSPYFS